MRADSRHNNKVRRCTSHRRSFVVTEIECNLLYKCFYSSRLLGRRKPCRQRLHLKHKQFGGPRWGRDKCGTAVPCPQGELYLEKDTKSCDVLSCKLASNNSELQLADLYPRNSSKSANESEKLLSTFPWNKLIGAQSLQAVWPHR